MDPDSKKIDIKHNNIGLIKRLLHELVLGPRLKALKWSRLTHQTSNIKVGYIGQHLASLVVGKFGQKSGARGHDITDGSEVKSCSRLDALDTCINKKRSKLCNEKVSRHELICPRCGSDNIRRGNASKWLFTVHNPADLKLLTSSKRIILVLSDYPKFEDHNFDEIRFQVFEIWPNSKRGAEFKKLMSNYLNNIYNKNKERKKDKNPAPKNLWPDSYQFYKCNPVRVFSCIVKNANTKPRIQDIFYIPPHINRHTLKSELMPASILTKDEQPALKKMIERTPRTILKRKLNPGKSVEDFSEMVNAKKFKRASIGEFITFFDEELRSFLPLRADKPFSLKTKHVRRKT